MAQQIDIVANLLMKVDGAEAGINRLKSGLSKLKLPDNLDKNLLKSFTNLDGIFERYRNQLNKGFQTKGDVTGFAKIGKELDSEMSRISKYMTELTGKQIDFKVNSEPIKKAEQELEKLLQQQQKLTNATLNFKIGGPNGSSSIQKVLDDIQKIAGDTNVGKAATSALENFQLGNIDKAVADLDRIIESYKRLGKIKRDTEVAGTGLNITQAASAVKSQIEPIAKEFQEVKTQVDSVSASLGKMHGEQIDKAASKANKLAKEMEQTAAATNQANKAAQEYASSSFRMVNQLDQLKSSTQYFFGLRNMFMLLKRGINQALTSVKELDKAMTATAVVTPYSVNDLWGMLPQYTKLANDLGATTQGAYETMTLYYQQGLNQEQAFALGTETMKMARIAGLDYAKTTDMMTAALRGFNMELNETSASHVNDVYSELAARTASNTQEIGEAMQRTASIAHSAGMSFEGTSAFLAQMIETTREAPENLGTAMKTIIARFQELKKNPLEISEVDGEEVSYNKIDSALQSIGVALKKANGEFRNLDEVFLDIAQRWDGLTQTQQRFIATTAAGSRQQSRFIAMMSDYERTQELMSYATQSAGASDKQFEKTMESMEAKLNKLKNAWQQFTMGIADNKILKTFVDGLTTTITIANKLIDTFSFGSSAVKSFLSLFLAFKGLSIGGRLINNLIGGVGGILTPGSSFVKGFWGASHPNSMNSGPQSTSLAGKITTPIVAKLNELIAVTRNQKTSQPMRASTLANYNDVVGKLHKAGVGGAVSMGSIQSMFNTLSDEHAYSAYRNSPGTVLAMKQASAQWLKGQNFDSSTSKVGQQLMNGIYKGMQKKEISVNQGLKLLGKPALWGSYFGTDVAKTFSQQYVSGIKQQVPNIKKQTNQAVEQTWTDLGMKLAAPETRKNYLADTTQREKFISAFRVNRQKFGLEDSIANMSVAQTTAQQLGNRIGTLGSKFSSTGMSIQMFGAQLAMLHPALQGIGTTISTIGMGLSTLGMGLSGLGKPIAYIAGLVGNIGGIGAALAAIAPAAAVAIPAIIALGVDLKRASDTKKAAKNIVETFETSNKSATDSINKLEEWKSEFMSLSQGVDINGNNINLDTQSYDRYREIVNGIAEINPSIVSGYNAQGDAIIANNQALEDTLTLQKQIRAEAAAEYTKNTSLQKLIDARNLNTDFSKTRLGTSYDPFDQEVAKLKRALEKEFDINDFNKKIGFDITKATKAQLSQNADRIEKIIDGYDDISDNTMEVLDSFVEANDKRLAATEDVYKALSMYASQQKYDVSLPQEFNNIYQDELKQIAANPNYDARQMKAAARTAAQKIEANADLLRNMTKAIEEAQEDYTNTLKKQDYLDQISKIRKEWNDKIQEWKGSSDEADKLLAEQAENILSKATDWTSTASSNLTNAFNTTADSIAAMTSAYDEFKKTIEGTTTVGAEESLNKIIEEMYSGTNALYGGNGAYWAGASYFVDDELLGDFEKTDKLIQRVKPALQDTEDGLYESVSILHDMAVSLQETKYADYIKPTDNGGFELPKTLTSKDWAEMLEASDFRGLDSAIFDLIISNASRVGSFTTANIDEIRKGYSTDDRTLKLEKDETGEYGQIYIKEGELLSDIRAANALDKKDEITEGLKAVGVDTIPDKIGKDQEENNADLTKKLGKEINSNNWATQLDQLRYDKDEILDYVASRTDLVEGEDYETRRANAEEEYAELIAEKENPLQVEANNTLNSILGYVDSINAAVGGDKPPKPEEYKGQELYNDIVGKSGNDTDIQKIGAGLYDIHSRDDFNQTYDYIKGIRDSSKEYLNVSEENLENVKSLYKKGKATQSDVDLAQDDYNKASIAYKVADKNVQRFEGSQIFGKYADAKTQFTTGFHNLIKDMKGELMKPYTVSPTIADFYNNASQKLKNKSSDNKLSGFNLSDIIQPAFALGAMPESWKQSTSNIADNFKNLFTPLTFTPMLQDDNGKSQVLNGQAISGLLQGITQNITKTNNGIDLNNLFKIDQNDFKDSGQEIYDLLMGAFGEENTEEFTGAFNEMQNKLDVSKKLTKDIAKDASKAAKDTIKNLKASQATKSIQTSEKNTLTTETIKNEKTTKTEETTKVTNEETRKTVVADGKETPKYKSVDKSLLEHSKNPKIQATLTANATGGEKIDEIATKTEQARQKASTPIKIATEASLSGLQAVQNGLSSLPSSKNVSINATDNTAGVIASISARLIALNAQALAISLRAANGLNNYISYSPIPTFSSAAKGKGTVGPKNKGGLTLTGEEGFEIAWLPNEGRSAILGVGGPQLINLPADAVVYTHEQSKDILKRKSIPAGSHAGTTPGSVSGRPSSSTTTKNNTTSNNSGKDDKVTAKEDKNADNAAKVIAKAGWVQAWWENMTRRIDATQRRVDNSLSLFEKKIKTFGTTVTSIKSTVDAYKKNLNHSIALNKNEVNQAKYELKQLTNPNSWYNRKEVSYEETTGDKKETKKMTIKLANYIKYNQQEGTYEIRQDMLDKVGLKGWTDGKGKKHPANQALAQAIKDAAEKEINDRNNKLKTAEDNIKKAQEALEKLSNDIYETFYKWEKSINKVYILSQKLEMLNSKLSISSAKVELQFSKMEAGAMTAAQGLSRIRTELSNQETTLLNKATASRENLSATKKAFQDSLTVQPYLSNLLKNPDSTEARNDLIAAKKAFTFLDTVNLSGDNFDYNKALSYLNTQQISKDEYDAIKGVLDGIFDKQKNYLDAQEQSYQSINEIYQTMEEYQSFITDFEKDLLSGIEEQAEDQVKKLDKLNSSLSKAYKDLIDEVKQNLDERRKQEDNAKTESDIAKKQQRLSMLRADTSGGHAVEIAQLEKEIADAQQNYQRSLEDQLIEKLQHQGDEAEKQRQHQIDLLNIQNEIARETGSNLAQVNEWLKNPTSIAQHYEDIKAAWLANKGYDEATDHEKEQLEQQFEVDFAKYQGYSEQLKSYETMIKDLDKIENQVNTIATNVSMDRPSYTAKDMKAQGYSAYSLKTGGYNAQQLRDAGYTPQEIKKAGYTAEQFAAGYKSIINNSNKSATEKATARQQGISAMHQAGYSNNDIAKQFGAQSTMQVLNASGKTVQSALGNDKNATAKYLQTQIVNKGGKNISQSDMEGVQVNIVTPDKKTVLAAIKGNYAYGHYGSTLYAQKWDSKTGTLTGTPAKYSIGGMTPEVMKAAGWEGMAALEYAIKTQQWGSIINKKFQQLTAAAGINGKEYTLGAKGHNWSASVGGDGLIYQNVKEGVAKWNPATGKTWVENYNKQHFIEVAKRNNGPSREYAQVLKAKGITKYATGGLADFTGPAWLDGTPSKPELVLNAQDTKNFVALKDVLSKAIGSTHAISNEYGGDTTFEININVDHIANDYDVDKMAERVKKIIVKDSSYRNVTQVRKFR